MQSDLPSRAAESRSLHEVPHPEDAILRKMSYYLRLYYLGFCHSFFHLQELLECHTFHIF